MPGLLNLEDAFCLFIFVVVCRDDVIRSLDTGMPVVTDGLFSILAAYFLVFR
jgi:hypothetical protein